MVPAWMVPPPPPPPPPPLARSAQQVTSPSQRRKEAPSRKQCGIWTLDQNLYGDCTTTTEANLKTNQEEDAERLREMAPKLDLQPTWRSASPASADSVGLLTYWSQ
ncbi:uncharacterized protein LOC113934466 [Zalophus californianus]|uniref:Uncharacterized protein LOC113934466 n=1 Tax=Zalophus californianus TaxID=9704 RepID=A0A6J2ET13_ZALCA|nr:uncharacterized protein LOC113934466 [Zalophus californianus]